VRIILFLLHEILPKIKRLWQFKGLYLYIPHDVFNPVYTLTTSFMAENLPHLKGKKVLDMGCGSGILALVAKRMGAHAVVGYDKSLVSIAVSNINARLNNLKGIFTNKLESVAASSPYHVIVTNPPYLPLEPRGKIDKLWSGGSDYRFLLRMIVLSRMFIDKKGLFILGLSSITGLDPKKVSEILWRAGFKVIGFQSKKYPTETLYIVYSIPRTNSLTSITLSTKNS
jgi:methylase of polypeptide subunit release factors